MLPPEVEDIIIDYNFNDPKTLARCALVCRGWLDTTRFHLWRTVSLGNYGEHDPDEFLARINEQPDIALHVREVKVMFPLSSPRPHFLDTLLRLFAVLPQAERLLLDRIYSDPLIPSETSTFPSHNPVVSKNLKFLKISRCRFDNTEPLERLFRAFPNIQDFSVLRSFTIGSSFLTSRSHGENEFRGSLLPHLSKLRVISLNQSFLMTWMSRFVHLSDVTTLEIGMHEGHVESWLSSIILAMSHKLESIRFVNSTYTPSWRQFLGHLDLSLATSLKSLSIETRSDDSHESINHIFLSILQQLSSPQIEEISLRLDTATFIHKSTLHAIDWNALDDFLDGKLFRKLRRLVFSVGRYSGAFKDNQEAVLRSLAKDIVLKSFGKAEKRGVEVSYVYGNLKAR